MPFPVGVRRKLLPPARLRFPFMPQTLMALFALGCATYYSWTRQRAIVEDQIRLVQNEVEMIAASVAVDRLEEISGKSFDHATAGGAVLSSSTSLTAAASFGKEAGGFDDVDDYHNGADTLARKAGTSTLPFRVYTTVSYANEASPETAATSRTKVKTVTATVTSLTVKVPASVVMKRSFTCGAQCSW
jgi:hypothetical protein